MQRFQDLKVWQKGHALALEVYKLSERFPRDERYGLVSQLRRAAASVPTNIAEGTKRQHQQEYARFLNIAEGSVGETEYLLILSRDLGYVPGAAADPLVAAAGELAKMLCSLRERVMSHPEPKR